MQYALQVYILFQFDNITHLSMNFSNVCFFQTSVSKQHCIICQQACYHSQLLALFLKPITVIIGYAGRHPCTCQTVTGSITLGFISPVYPHRLPELCLLLLSIIFPTHRFTSSQRRPVQLCTVHLFQIPECYIFISCINILFCRCLKKKKKM